MLGLDQMTEQELLAGLYRLADGSIGRSRLPPSGQFSKDPIEGVWATQDEQNLLAEMNRLMDRRRAVEGHLMRVRGQLQSLSRHELGKG
jgi:hypothetical protein